MRHSPISFTSQLGYEELGINQQLRQTLLLTLQAEDIQPLKRSPISMMLCVDLSGSMMGKPLQLIHESIQMLIDQLDEHDRLGMVTFSNQGKLICPLRYLDAEGQGFFSGVLHGMQAIGGTNLSEGLRLAFEHMPTSSPHELYHIVLLSDGKPTRGEIETAALQHHVKGFDPRISLTCFGYGTQHDETLLLALANDSKGGGYAYIESEDVAPLAFAKELGGLFSTIASDIRLVIRPEPPTSILEIIGTKQIKRCHNEVHLTLPTMIANQHVHLLLKLQMQTPSQEGHLLIANTEFRYLLIGNPSQQISIATSIQCQVTSTPSWHCHPEVQTRLLLQEVADAWEESHHLAEKKEFEHAIKRLTPFLDRLQASHEFKKNESETRNWYEQLIDEIAMYSKKPSPDHLKLARKAATSEMPLPTGNLRRTNSSIINLNGTQRNLLKGLMQKVFGVPHAYLIVQDSPKELHIEQTIFPILGEASIGRLAEIQLAHPSVSKKHIRLVATPKGYLMIGLLSSRPPLLNNQPIQGPTLLHDKDLITIGDFVLSFHLGLAPSILKNRHPRFC